MTPRPHRKWLRFSLGGLLVFVALVAVYLGIIVNRPNCQAEVLVLFTGEGVEETASISNDLIKKALDRSSVRGLQSVRSKAKPERWLSSRLTVERLKSSDVVTISISGNSYRDNPADFVPILNSVVEEIVNSASPSQRIMVVSQPTLSGRVR